jgi:hypothetical protein
LVLSFCADNKEDAERLAELALFQLYRLLERKLDGIMFVYRLETYFDQYLLARHAQNGIATEEWQYRTDISIVGNSQELATKRLESTVDWINQLAKRSYKHLDGIDFLVAESSDTIISPQDLSIDPMVQVANYPFASRWTLVDLDESIPKTSIDQVFERDEWESLSLGVDTVRDAVMSLKMTSELLPHTRNQLDYWKWTIISLHNAVQGFMVLALQSTNAIPVLKAPMTPAPSGQYDPPQLIDFQELYNRIKKEEFMGMFVHSRTFKPDGTQGGSIKHLNRLRNEFVHYTPKSWLFSQTEVLELPKLVDDCARLIAFLAFDSNNIQWYGETDQVSLTRDSIVSIRRNAFEISNDYADRASTFIGKGKVRKFRLPPP